MPYAVPRNVCGAPAPLCTVCGEVRGIRAIGFRILGLWRQFRLLNLEPQTLNLGRNLDRLMELDLNFWGPWGSLKLGFKALGCRV